jgi:ketosteroid isomerase-like protein
VAAEADKALVRRLFEDVWNLGNLEAAGEIVDQHYSSIENQTFTSTPGPQIVAADLELYRSLYDGLNFKIKQMFTEGHTIVTIWTASGTSKVETFVDRSGRERPKSLEAEGVSLTEVRDGKITAHRFLWPRDPLFP